MIGGLLRVETTKSAMAAPSTTTLSARIHSFPAELARRPLVTGLVRAGAETMGAAVTGDDVVAVGNAMEAV
jgi:hypothetical protein